MSNKKTSLRYNFTAAAHLAVAYASGFIASASGTYAHKAISAKWQISKAYSISDDIADDAVSMFRGMQKLDHCTKEASKAHKFEIETNNRDFLRCMDSQIGILDMGLPLAIAAGAAFIGWNSLWNGLAYRHFAKKASRNDLSFRLIDDIPTESFQESPATKQWFGKKFKIAKGVQPYAAIVLNANESAYAESGALFAKSSKITARSIVSTTKSKIGSSMGRLLSGEGFAVTEYTNNSSRSLELTLNPHVSGDLEEIDLTAEKIIFCRNGAFFASSSPVNIGLKRIKNFSFTTFSDTSLTMQSISILEQPAKILLSSEGQIKVQTLKANETIEIGKGALLALTGGVSLGLSEIKGLFTKLSDGQGRFVTTLTGPGKVWLTTAPKGKSEKSSTGLIASVVNNMTPG